MKRSTMIYDKTMHEARKYWRDQLPKISFKPLVALDHPRPRDRAQSLQILGRELSGQVHGLSKSVTRGSPFLSYTVLLVGLQICGYRYGGASDLPILCPARNSEDGLVNLLPIGGILDPNASFQELLLATKERLTEAFRHPHYPLSDMLSMSAGADRAEDLSLVASLAGLNDQIPEVAFDIGVHFDVTEKVSEVTLRYDARLYEESTLSAFFDSMDAILRQGLVAMATPIRQLDPWSSRDDATIEGPAPKNVEELIHRRIATRAAENPEDLAVRHGERELTYADLDEQADRLATRLRRLGLDRREPVAVLMAMGVERVISQLAVAKSGLAFAPVELLALGASVEQVIDSLGCRCLLCRPEHLEDLSPLYESLPTLDHVIALDYSEDSSDEVGESLRFDPLGSSEGIGGAGGTESGSESGREDRAEALEIGPLDIACVLLGAGPGGLSRSELSHAELSSLFDAVNSRLGVGPEDLCLATPALASGDQLFDTLGVLSAGAGLEIPATLGGGDRSTLLQSLLAEGITTWNLPVALMPSLLPELGAGEGPRRILLSGEKQDTSLADRLRARFPEVRVLGAYAPPSLGAWTTIFAFEPDPERGRFPVLAEPIAGFEHRVLDGVGDAVPPAARGELHLLRRRAVGGAEASVEMATGLRVRILADRRLAWLRGHDHEFFEGGCGVELTAIEQILNEQEGVLTAEVMTVETGIEGRESVVAFVVTEKKSLSPEDLRDLLVHHGDIDLVPDRFIVLPELPLDPVGAIDAEALLQNRLSSGDSRMANLSSGAEEIVQQLRKLWLEALQIDAADETSSFFKLGGNSLKATLLIARIRDVFSVDIPVQDFFREPSLHAVAGLIEVGQQGTENRTDRPDFKIVSRERYRVQMPNLDEVGGA